MDKQLDGEPNLQRGAIALMIGIVLIHVSKQPIQRHEHATTNSGRL